MPMWAKVAIAATLGVVSFAVVSDGAFALTQRLDPSLGTLVRNRYIASAIGTAGGIALAMKSPLYGAAVAAGAAAAGLGAQATFLLGKVFDKATPTQQGLGAVYGQMGGYEQMNGYQPMGAVYGQMGAVYGQMGGYERMGSLGSPSSEYVPPAPYSVANPFGF